MNDRSEFQGQNAVVTGGAQGIGKAIAARLMAGGARVPKHRLQKLIALRTELGLQYNTFSAKFETFDAEMFNRPLTDADFE